MKQINFQNTLIEFSDNGQKLRLHHSKTDEKSPLHSPYNNLWIEKAKRENRSDVLYGAARLALAYVYKSLPKAEQAIFDGELRACGDSIVRERTDALKNLWRKSDFDKMRDGIQNGDIESYARLSLLALQTKSPENVARLVPFLASLIETDSDPSGCEFQAAYYDTYLRKESATDELFYVYGHDVYSKGNITILDAVTARKINKEALCLHCRNALVAKTVLHGTGWISEYFEDHSWTELLEEDDEIDFDRIDCATEVKFEMYGDGFPGWDDGNYPTWGEAEMIRCIPESVQEKFGSVEDSRVSDPCLQIRVEDTESVIRELLLDGAAAVIHVPNMNKKLTSQGSGWVLRHPDYPWVMDPQDEVESVL